MRLLVEILSMQSELVVKSLETLLQLIVLTRHFFRLPFSEWLNKKPSLLAVLHAS